MDNSEIVARMNDALAASGGTDKSVKFDFGDDGKIFLSGTEAVEADNDADCTISVSKDDFIALAGGNLDPMMAFMSGKLKLEGNAQRALKVSGILTG